MYTKDYLYTWDDYGLPEHILFKNFKASLEDFEAALNSEKNGLPSLGIQYSLSYDEIKSGGMFNKKHENCLVLSTSEIPSSANFIFTVQNMGNVTQLSIYRTLGASQARINQKNRRMSGGAISKLAGVMTKIDESAIEKEELYYNAVIEVIRKLFLP